MPASQEEIQSLLLAFELGELTTTEQETLMNAALDDPTIFEQLWHATRHREFLQRGNDRQRLAALCIAPSKQPFFSRFRLVALTPVALALIYLATIFWPPHSQPGLPDLQSASGGKVNPIIVRSLFAAVLPTPSGEPVRLLPPDTSAPGSNLVRFQLNLTPGQSLLVIRKQASSDPELVWPPTLAQSPIPPQSDAVLTFDRLNPTGAPSNDPSLFRFLIAPAGVDLRLQPFTSQTGIQAATISVPSQR